MYFNSVEDGERRISEMLRISQKNDDNFLMDYQLAINSIIATYFLIKKVDNFQDYFS